MSLSKEQPRGYDFLRTKFWDKYGHLYDSEFVVNYEALRNEFRTRLQLKIPTVIWQQIASFCDFKSRLRLSCCDHHLHDEVIYGPYNDVWIWRYNERSVYHGNTTKLYGAINSNNVPLVKALVKSNMFNEFMDARYMCTTNLEIIEVLLDAGMKSDPYQAINYRYITEEECFKVLSFLLSKGCAVNKKAIHTAGRTYDSPRMMDLLLDAYANDCIPDGEILLNTALSRGHVRIVVLLVKRGVNVNAPVYNKPPLVYLIKNNDYINSNCMRCIKILLEAGANPNICINGRTLMRYVTRFIDNNDELLVLLKSYGGRMNRNDKNL